MTRVSTNLHDAVFCAAKIWPENIALIEGNSHITYAELSETALLWASTLRQHMGKEGGNVGILSKRDSFACTAVLSVLAAGMTYVPLNVDYPEALLKEIAATANLDAVIVAEDSLSLAVTISENVAVPLFCSIATLVEENASTYPLYVNLSGADRIEPEPSIVDVESSAYLLFTSGSTGPSKGVAIPHRAIVAFLTHMQEVYAITPTDRLTQLFNHSFDLSLFDLFMAWRNGASLVILDPDAPDLVDRVNEQAITIWFSVPSVATRLMRAGKLGDACLPTLRLSLFCGEPLYGSIAVAWQRSAHNSCLENLYGPTELTVACSRYPIEQLAVSEDAVVPIGRVFPGLHWAICQEDGQPVVGDEVGELCVGGPQMFEGYWNSETLNVGRFHADRSGNQLYRTGDLVRLSGDILLFVGRSDTQIKLNGYRIELGQIESALRRAGAHEAVAITWPSSLRPTAIRVAVSGGASPSDLSHSVTQLLPPQMIPADITSIAKIPLNRNGKVDRAQVAEILRSTKKLLPIEFVVAEALNIPIGAVRDDLTIFSICGWDSLGHARLMIALEDNFNINLDHKHINQIRSFRDVRNLVDGGLDLKETQRSSTIHKGLVGIVMDRTSISKIDGERGHLSYRGYAIEDLCDHASFEEIAHLLVAGRLPDSAELKTVRKAFSRSQKIENDCRAVITASAHLHPVRALAIAAASSELEDPYEIIGHMAASVGTWIAAQTGRPFEPALDLAHHERLARYILPGQESDTAHEFIRQDLILHAEHGANASTLALRTAVSTGSRLVDAIAAAIMTFGGPIHGGAVEGVAEMLDRVGQPENARLYVNSERRVMGFGHRIYRTDDPRAVRLRSLVERLIDKNGDRRPFDIAVRVFDEMELRRDKGVGVNIDLFAAVGYRLLGIDAKLGTVVAILGRAAGWCAHALEQRQNNILIRPDLFYDGPVGLSLAQVPR